MGLDWCLRKKPRKNYEIEYYRLKYKIQSLHEELYNETVQENIYKIEEKLEVLEKEFDDFSISVNETSKTFSKNDIQTLNNCLIDGSFVSNEWDFRGDVIGCSEILDEELKMEAYENHNSLESIEYAIKLEIFLEKVNKNELDEDDIEDYNNILKAIDWLKFWGVKGHGYCTDY